MTIDLAPAVARANQALEFAKDEKRAPFVLKPLAHDTLALADEIVRLQAECNAIKEVGATTIDRDELVGIACDAADRVNDMDVPLSILIGAAVDAVLAEVAPVTCVREIHRLSQGWANAANEPIGEGDHITVKRVKLLAQHSARKHEEVKRLNYAVSAAKALIENIVEFGRVTDGEILGTALSAVNQALPPCGFEAYND